MNTLLLFAAENIKNSNSGGYIVGIIISVLILGYLVYSLIKPEKF